MKAVRSDSVALVRKALALSYDALSGKTIENVKKLLIDSLACAMAGAAQSGVDETLRVLERWGGREESTVWFKNTALPSPHAAMINSAMVHAMDFDDVHLPGILHIMSSMMPTTFAVGESVGATGREIIQAIAAGVEVAGRISRTYQENSTHRRFLDSSVCGGFGTTVAAACLLGLDEKRIVDAMGIFHAQASGNRQALYERTLTKRLQPGFAARDAVWAAWLAKQRVSGPEQALEGPCGLYRTYGNVEELDLSPLTVERDFLEIDLVSTKLYPTCGAQHPAISAAIEIGRENQLAYDDIADVEYFLAEGGISSVDKPFVMEDNPQTNAQFSASYGVALGLIRHDASVSRFDEKTIQSDQEVLDLERRIKLVTHCEKVYGSFEPDDPICKRFDAKQWVRVKTKDGRTFFCVKSIRDVLSPNSTVADAIRKFHDCAEYSGWGDKSRHDQIIHQLAYFDEVDEISEFISLIN